MPDAHAGWQQALQDTKPGKSIPSLPRVSFSRCSFSLKRFTKRRGMGTKLFKSGPRLLRYTQYHAPFGPPRKRLQVSYLVTSDADDVCDRLPRFNPTETCSRFYNWGALRHSSASSLKGAFRRRPLASLSARSRLTRWARNSFCAIWGARCARELWSLCA